MPYRGRSNPLTPGVVDIDTARRAVAQVARERDALAQQLQRAQGRVASLQRQLDARSEENAHLEQAVRVLESRSRPAEEIARERSRFDRQTAVLNQQLEQLTDQLERVHQERDEILADCDRERAARHASEARAQAVPQPSPAEDRAQRLAADLSNLRRHQAESIENGVRGQTNRLLVEIGSIRDSVERALESLPGQGSTWHDGLVAVLSRVDSVLDREGVHRVGLPGERFDPGLHEAVGKVDDGGTEWVRQTVSSGLVRADGSVVVPAMVLVGGE